MILILSVSLLISILSLFVTITRNNILNNEVKELQKEMLELEKVKDKYFDEIETNKNMYNSDKRAVVSENKSLKIQNENLKEMLNKYSKEESLYYSQMDNLVNSSITMSVKEFLEIRSRAMMKDSNVHDFTGIYILENLTHDKFYIGQSISLYKRAGQHFIKEGSNGIYEDYMNGDEWTVKLISLANSGFNSINALEKHFIKYYKSTHNGYNRTVGNIN